MPDLHVQRASKRGEAFWAVWAITAAFGTYFCMYGFRKPFTAAGFEGEPVMGADLKSVLVISQVIGYTISKFMGIKIVSELAPARRAWAIVALIAFAQAALVLFGFLPRPYSFIALFLNGLPLGMVFGLVLGFLEGRRLTEALSAGLCASFILAGGVSKSVGLWLIQAGISDQWMPAAAGCVFALPLVLGTLMLSRIPPPSIADRAERSERHVMSAADRRSMLARLGVGLIPLVLMFVFLTVLRGLRDDFAPELWKGLGAAAAPSDFAISELWVGLGCFALGGAFALLRDNNKAFFGSLAACAGGFILLAATLAFRERAELSPMAFMVLVGLGMYIPYVVVHTTVFERLLAVTREKGNLAFLMYIADSFGYLGYAAIVLGKGALVGRGNFLSFFTLAGWVSVGVSLVCLLISWVYFARRANERRVTVST
jgi:hypothetical protein